MELKLIAEKRTDTGRHNRSLRASGRLPAVVYGHSKGAQPLLLDSHEFTKVFRRAGRSHLVDLVIDGGRAHKVLIKDLQVHPRQQITVHVDLYTVDLKEKLHTEVALTFTGESPAAKLGVGDVMPSLHALRVECLPGDIPDRLEVDLSALVDVESAIRVEDIKLPEGVTALHEADDLVVKIHAHRTSDEPTDAVETTPESAAAPGEDADKPADS